MTSIQGSRVIPPLQRFGVKGLDQKPNSGTTLPGMGMELATFQLISLDPQQCVYQYI